MPAAQGRVPALQFYQGLVIPAAQGRVPALQFYEGSVIPAAQRRVPALQFYEGLVTPTAQGGFQRSSFTRERDHLNDTLRARNPLEALGAPSGSLCPHHGPTLVALGFRLASHYPIQLDF